MILKKSADDKNIQNYSVGKKLKLYSGSKRFCCQLTVNLFLCFKVTREIVGSVHRLVSRLTSRHSSWCLKASVAVVSKEI